MSNETDLDWLARNVHVWPAGDHQPWCYVYWKAGRRVVSGNFITVINPCAKIDKSDWLARRAELQNKPSWGSVGGEVNFISQHEDGQWIGHSEKPEEGDKCFECDCIISLFGYGEVLGDWRDTLEKRPEEFQPFTSIEDNQEQDMAQQQEMKQDNGWFKRGDLPPVGSNVTIVEIDGLGISDLGREFIGDECKVMATFVRPAVFHGDEAKIVAVMEPAGGCYCFRLEMVKPIRTEREVAIEEMQSDIAERWANCEELARHLVDKGWVKAGK